MTQKEDLETLKDKSEDEPGRGKMFFDTKKRQGECVQGRGGVGGGRRGGRRLPTYNAPRAM